MAEEYDLIEIKDFPNATGASNNDFLPISQSAVTRKIGLGILSNIIISLNNILTRSDIANNLTTESTIKALSALQGVILNGKINDLNTLINNITAQIGSGIIGEAVPTTIPITEGFGVYLVSTAGTYINFLDSGSDPIVVTSNDLQNGIVQLWGNNGVWEKQIIPIGRPLTSVNYSMFGAIGDGITDDSLAIKSAHDFANDNNLPVFNPTGLFYLREGRSIEIKTNTDWGQTKFIVDERYYNGQFHFIVDGYTLWQDVELSPEEKTSFLSKWKRNNTGVFSELADYDNCYFIMYDENDVCYRNGFPGQSKPKLEQFVIEKGGALIGDVNWELTDYTTLKARRMEVPLTISGGQMDFIGGGSIDPSQTGYQNTWMLIKRSRTTIENFLIDRPESEIVNNKPSNGFFFFNECAFVIFRNGRLVPKVAGGQGSYGLGGDIIFEFTMERVQADGDGSYWGFMAPNHVKNMRIRECKLNRIDVHFNAWNVYIDDTEIGTESIRLSGGGDLFINRTINHGGDAVAYFLVIRSDWTASWDGMIRIDNCEHNVINPSALGSWVQWSHAQFNYNAKQILCSDIYVTNSNVNFNNNNNDFRMMWMPFRSKNILNTIQERIIFPRRIYFKNIAVTGRTKGIIPLSIQYSNDFQPYAGAANTLDIVEEYNTLIHIENVATRSQYDTFNILEGFPDNLNTAFVKPQITFKNMKSNLEIYINKGTAKIIGEDCILNRLAFGSPNDATYANISARFTGCVISPITRGDADELSRKPIWINPSSRNPSFINCTIENGRNFGVAFTTYLQWARAVQGLFTPQRVQDEANLRWYKSSLLGHHSNTFRGASLLALFSSVSISVPIIYVEELHSSRYNIYNAQLPRTRGASTQRPTPDATPITSSGSPFGVPYDGFIYFDTTLQKPLFWDTSGWKDGAGNVIT